MDSGKGKGPAPPEGSENGRGKPQSKQEKPSANSLLSRVAASASGLTRSAFSEPNSSEINQGTAAALSSSGKATTSGSGSGSSTWAESSKSSLQRADFGSGGASQEGFRTGHSDQHVQQTEREFSSFLSFLDGIDSFQPSEPDPTQEGFPPEALDEAWARSWFPTAPSSSSHQTATVAQQESRDGEDVLAILSSPSEHFEAPKPEDENYDWGLSAEQLTQLRAMTKDIFPAPDSHIGIDAEHPLNLMSHTGPDFENGTLEGQEAWLEQWEGVLTRYADEVWGGLLPLVKEARREVEDLRGENASTEQSKALRRLGAILGHLQKR